MAKDFSDELDALLNEEESEEESEEATAGEAEEGAEESEEAVSSPASKKGRGLGIGGKTRGGRTGATRTAGLAGTAKKASKRATSTSTPDSVEKSVAPHKTVPASAMVSRPAGVSSGVLPLIGILLSVITVILLFFVATMVLKVNARLDAVERLSIMSQQSAEMAAKAARIKVSTFYDPKRRPQIVYTVLGRDVIDAKGKPDVRQSVIKPLVE